MRAIFAILVVLTVLVALAPIGVAQGVGEKKRVFLKGNFWKERPPRRLTQAEAEEWIKVNVTEPSRHSAGASMTFDPVQLIEVATADAKELRALMLREHPYGFSEAACRKDPSLVPTAREIALRGSRFGLQVWSYHNQTHLKQVFSEAYAKAPARSDARVEAAAWFLTQGDACGEQELRFALKNKPWFDIPFAHTINRIGEIYYLLIIHADAANRQKIAADLESAGFRLRERYPDLARLKRPAIDAELLKLAGSKDHALRKWVAMAARERLDSKPYREVLARLSKDPVEDVRQTARWVLGKDKPIGPGS